MQIVKTAQITPAQLYVPGTRDMVSTSTAEFDRRVENGGVIASQTSSFGLV